MRALGGLLSGVGAPDDPAVHVFPDESATRSELEQRATDLATRLRRAGVEPGHAVAVCLPNDADVVAALFGVWEAAAVYAPINPRLAATDRAGAIDSVRPFALVTEGLVVERLATDEPARHDDDVALVSFTSGTTGRPKPVVLRHSGVSALLDGVVATLRGARGGESKREPMPNLVPVSLSLWAGIYQVLFAFRVGAPVVILPAFTTSGFAEAVRRFGIRSTVLPPAAMTMLSDDEAITDLSPLRYVRSITAPLSPLQARRFRDRFGIGVMNGWGQTELGGEVVGWNAADLKEFGDQKLGAVGRPHAGVEVRVVDANGRDAAANDAGELCVRTAATTKERVDAAVADRLDAQGWFRTGDVGRVDEDGFVWIEGRVSDMINRGGLKVFPSEVAEVLRLSPHIADAHVAGVADERLGEAPWAFVVPADADELPADAELEALCREHLAPYKVPVRFLVVDALPRNEIGKVLVEDLITAAGAPR